jgi:hypothetical protein
MKTNQTLCLSTDPCPTGEMSLAIEDKMHMPLLPWFAMRRQYAIQTRCFKLAHQDDEAMAEIEWKGLLSQAEAAMSRAN